MVEAQYRNYQHYVKEGWANQPKESFKALVNLIRESKLRSEANCLDVGCATGELIYNLSSEFSHFKFFGIDIFDSLINEAKKFQPNVEFKKQSILELPESYNNSFDLITAIGVLSIFDENTLPLFFDNILRATIKNGKIYILAPFNEYGVDIIVKHRKRVERKLGLWETGWNVFSKETIVECLGDKCSKFRFIPFKISKNLIPKEDPVRTWTIETPNNLFQLTNGLKLLIDHYFIEITK